MISQFTIINLVCSTAKLCSHDWGYLTNICHLWLSATLWQWCAGSFPTYCHWMWHVSEESPLFVSLQSRHLLLHSDAVFVLCKHASDMWTVSIIRYVEWPSVWVVISWSHFASDPKCECFPNKQVMETVYLHTVLLVLYASICAFVKCTNSGDVAWELQWVAWLVTGPSLLSPRFAPSPVWV
jgi:hypothetical protein